MDKLSDRIRELIAQQGWNEQTQLGLLCDFIEERQEVPELFAYLAWVASGEPYPHNPPWKDQLS